jgi:20S proteasome alpha/beta subunit
LTVCIGALCGNSREVVVASDRMITATYPPIEFEHGMPKLEIVSSSCIVLTAGDALAHADLCRNVRARVGVLSRPKVAKITDEVRAGYVAQRLQTIEHRFLESRGWSIRDFYDRYMRTLPSDIIVTLDHQIANYNYGLSILVAGVDPDEAHIYGIRNPGETDCYDSLGYHAIGIGAMHAISSFIANGYLPTVDLKFAVYYAYEAKKNAENAPGVGKDIDMAIIQNGGHNIITTEQIDALEEIYETRRVHKTSEFQDAINGLPF